MRRGFTLIELLVVIAIVGILATVLIPVLLGARQQTIARTAQVHSSNVYTALTAYISANTDVSADDALVVFGGDCEARASVADFGWRATPMGVTCQVESAGDSDFRVETSGGGRTFVNGQE